MSEKKIIRKNSKTEPKNFLGLLPLGIDARHEFTPQVYLDNKVPKKLHPKFVIKPFNNELKRKWLRITKLIYLEEVYLSDKTIEEIKKYDAKEEEELREIIRMSIVGFSNFLTADGSEIDFKKDDDGYLDSDVFNLIHDSVVGDLTNELNRVSCLKAVELLGLD